jgi:hypothetical protein
VELVVADVDGGHARCAMLEEAVREAACRGADVKAVKSFDGKAKVDEGTFKLLTASAHEAGFGGERDLGVFGKGVARLRGGLAIHAHLAGQDETLGHLAALGEAAHHDKLV